MAGGRVKGKSRIEQSWQEPFIVAALLGGNSLKQISDTYQVHRSTVDKYKKSERFQKMSRLWLKNGFPKKVEKKIKELYPNYEKAISELKANTIKAANGDLSFSAESGKGSRSIAIPNPTPDNVRIRALLDEAEKKALHFYGRDEIQPAVVAHKMFLDSVKELRAVEDRILERLGTQEEERLAYIQAKREYYKAQLFEHGDEIEIEKVVSNFEPSIIQPDEALPPAENIIR